MLLLKQAFGQWQERILSTLQFRTQRKYPQNLPCDIYHICFLAVSLLSSCKAILQGKFWQCRNKDYFTQLPEQDIIMDHAVSKRNDCMDNTTTTVWRSQPKNGATGHFGSPNRSTAPSTCYSMKNLDLELSTIYLHFNFTFPARDIIIPLQREV